MLTFTSIYFIYISMKYPRIYFIQFYNGLFS